VSILLVSEQVRRFLAIEGLRGWLAWAVVFSHLAYISAFNARGASWFLRSIGPPSVLVFLIISGFVITHVILEKRESYGSYLVKRFARIFPLLAVTCFVGFFSNDLLALAVGDRSFGDAEFAKVAADVAASNHSHLPMHLLAHFFMFHGAIPNAVLMHSEYAFNMPAWSISLEWQFYVLAPLIIFVLRDKRQFLIPLAVTFAASGIALKQLSSGTVQPGALPLATLYFAIGILSRLAYSEKFETSRGLSFAIALAIALSPFSEFRPLLIWLVVFFGLPSINLRTLLSWSASISLYSKVGSQSIPGRDHIRSIFVTILSYQSSCGGCCSAHQRRRTCSFYPARVYH
jgi:peptidoglycan/LPS O-acetylase OafA/YrhL